MLKDKACRCGNNFLEEINGHWHCDQCLNFGLIYEADTDPQLIDSCSMCGNYGYIGIEDRVFDCYCERRKQ